MDAVWLYAYALKKAIDEGKDFKDVDKFNHIIRNLEISSTVGNETKVQLQQEKTTSKGKASRLSISSRLIAKTFIKIQTELLKNSK